MAAAPSGLTWRGHCGERGTSQCLLCRCCALSGAERRKLTIGTSHTSAICVVPTFSVRELPDSVRPPATRPRGNGSGQADADAFDRPCRSDCDVQNTTDTTTHTTAQVARQHLPLDRRRLASAGLSVVGGHNFRRDPPAVPDVITLVPGPRTNRRALAGIARGPRSTACARSRPPPTTHAGRLAQHRRKRHLPLFDLLEIRGAGVEDVIHTTP